MPEPADLSAATPTTNAPLFHVLPPPEAKAPPTPAPAAPSGMLKLGGLATAKDATGK
jgi:hypothetical protein